MYEVYTSIRVCLSVCLSVCRFVGFTTRNLIPLCTRNERDRPSRVYYMTRRDEVATSRRRSHRILRYVCMCVPWNAMTDQSIRWVFIQIHYAYIHRISYTTNTIRHDTTPRTRRFEFFFLCVRGGQRHTANGKHPRSTIGFVHVPLRTRGTY